MEDSAIQKRAGTTDYCTVVRKKYVKLQKAMQNPSLISGYLFAEDLISRTIHQTLLTKKDQPRVKAAIAIDAVLSVLEVSESAEQDMIKFCKALEESGEPSLLNVVAEMKKEANICQSPMDQQRNGQDDVDAGIPESIAEPADQNLLELLTVMESLKRQSLSLKFRLVKFILTGTPRVGKSTLKKRIMKEITNLSDHLKVNPSTGLEKPCVVQVTLEDDKAERAALIILHSSKKSSRAWKNQDLHEQLSLLFDSMLNEKDGPLKAEMSDKSISSQASKCEDDVTATPQVQINPASSSSPPASSLSLVTDVGMIAQSINWKKAKEQLALLIQKTTSVYIMDTGGQPEFHEVLPFVLQGPALHLVLFSLLEGTNCLDKQFEVEYVSEKGTSIDPYKSVYPVKEVLFQLLASFHSLHKSGTHNQHLADTVLNPSLDTPQAILIGTYKDEFVKTKTLSQQKQCLDEVNQKLIATFKGSEFYEKSFLSTVHPGLQCAGTYTINGDNTINGDRFFVAMDNVYGTREEMDLFREFLTDKISEVAHPIELPCSVLLFHLLLRYNYETKPGICTIEESKELAKKCRIADEDVTKVLKYLHITLGTILYYEDVPSLQNTVFCDPNVLLSQINELIAVCFTCDPNLKVMANTTRETGVIDPELWEHVCRSEKYQGPISKEQVIDFLVHYKLMIETESEQGVKNWFMPCLMLPNPEVATITTDFLECVPVCPLLIGFNGNVVPLGQFSSLIIRLCLKQWNDEEPWELANTKRYRNQVTFLTDILLCVRLTARPQFIEVLVEESNEATKEELQVFCFKARQHVMEAIKETQSGHRFDCGFYCPGSLSPGQTPHYAKARNVKVMRCSREKECGHSHCPVPPQGYMWLQETKLTATKDLSTGSSAGVSSVPPRMQSSSLTGLEAGLMRSESDRISMGTGGKQPSSTQSLDVPCHDKYLAKLAHSIQDWEIIAVDFDITSQEADTIKRDLPQQNELQKRKMLMMWKKKFGNNATYRRLVEIFESIDNKLLADRIKEDILEN